MARRWAAPTAKRWAVPDRRRRWSSSRRCSTNDGRSRSKRRPLFLRFGALAGFDVQLERFHVLANPRRVLRREHAGREAKQASELVIHLVDQSRRSILPRRVRVRPRPVQRALDEPSRALLRLVPHVLLDLERLFVPREV